MGIEYWWQVVVHSLGKGNFHAFLLLKGAKLSLFRWKNNSKRIQSIYIQVDATAKVRIENSKAALRV